MPKKHRNPQLLTKPRPTLPPTLSSSTSSTPPRASHTDSSTASSDSQSVNQILSRLRLSQSTRRTARTNNVDPTFATRTVHPSLQGIFTDAPAPLYLPPRQRSQWPNGVPANYVNRRGTAGPPAPRSWLSRDENVVKKKAGRENNDRMARWILQMPGLMEVDRRSLTHGLLEQMARDWQEIFVYERYYLWEMSTSLKALLLAYIAAYSNRPIDVHGLDILFGRMDDEDDNEEAEESSLVSTEPEGNIRIVEPDVSSLTLAFSLGRTMTLKDLKTFLTLPQTLLTPDSWDTPSLPPTTHRFPNLTHLNLSYPNPAIISYPRFIDFARAAIPTITHLSLAGWPDPPDFSHLTALSNSLLCLKWLDVTDCSVGFLKLLAEMRWDGPWKKMEGVCVGVAGEELDEMERAERNEVARRLQERIWETQPKAGVVCKVVVKMDWED